MISEKSTVETKDIGKNVQIGEYCVIRNNVKIGDNVIIHPHVIIDEGVIIEDNVEIFAGALIGKEPKAPDIIARKLNFSRKILIGRHCVIGPHSIIYYDVSIGQKCLLGDAVAIRENCKVGDRCILGRHVSLNYNVFIGDDSIIMTKSHITGNTHIGKKVFISAGVCMANDNNFGDMGYDENNIRGPVIEDFVKIGVGAVILPNIRIEENALVAAGAVVTRDVKKNSEVMGVPARHIKYLPPVK